MPNYCKGEACAGRQKRANYGPKGGKRQWCGPCAEKQEGETELIGANMCEDCRKKRAHYGLTDTGKPRWCAGCAEGQVGETERIDKNKMCEGCNIFRPSYAQPDKQQQPHCCDGPPYVALYGGRIIMFVRFSIFLSISLVAPLSSGASCDISAVRKSCPSGTFSSAAVYSVPHSTQKQRPLSGKKKLHTFGRE
eukprot:COSAG04_NODE_1035_length_8610_cov_7.441194_8_plen_193_part_00